VIVGLMYVGTAPSWGSAGDWRLTLPAVDLPVAQMGLTVKAPPRYRLTPQPGDFHVQAFEPPLSQTLQLDDEKEEAAGARELKAARGNERDRFAATAPVPAPPPLEVSGPKPQEAVRQDQALGGLVERFQREARGTRTAGTLPVTMTFPDAGPGVYLAAALTAESTAPTAAFTFKRMVK
jgi:hypothetical protein